MMKCHYEVLSIERNATDDDIKKSYRKLALKWHPDKNPDQIDECTRQFHQIQQAYEVLIDPQERAWYDKHREAILRGGLGRGDKYEDDSLDVYQYFNTACYSGFGDDEKSFYSVYRKVFEDIAAEDKEFMDGQESDVEIPEFGNSQSNYEELVGPFYAYWESYCTMKSFVWKEKYDTREAGHRQIRRAMEQENKKLRDKAKKERNEEVRALVAFVRKRDKRVQAYKLKLEERAAEIHKLTQEKKKKQKEERLKQFEKFKEAGWSAMDGLEADLAALDAHYASDEKTEEEEENSGEDLEENAEGMDVDNTEEILFDDLYCVACNRAFKTEKAFENHENSKKHRDKVAQLKTEMEEDEELAENLQATDEDDECEEVLYDDLYCVVCDKVFSDEKALTSHVNSKKHKQSVRAFRGEPDEEENDSAQQSTEPKDADEADNSTDMTAKTKNKSKKQKKKRRKQQSSDEDEDLEEPVNDLKDNQDHLSEALSDRLNPEISQESSDMPKDTDVPTAAEETTASAESITCQIQSVDGGTQNKSSTTKKSTKPPSQPDSASQEPLYCNVCNGKFFSRNKLFQHIKDKGHALRVNEEQDIERTTSKKAKKKKGKR